MGCRFHHLSESDHLYHIKYIIYIIFYGFACGSWRKWNICLNCCCISQALSEQPDWITWPPKGNGQDFVVRLCPLWWQNTEGFFHFIATGKTLNFSACILQVFLCLKQAAIVGLHLYVCGKHLMCTCLV